MKNVERRIHPAPLLLALALLLALIPVGMHAFASETVVKVDSWTDFSTAMANDSTAGAGTVYQLQKDLTLSGMIPIVSSFKGTFDGMGHTISIENGSYFATSTDAGLGLFCEVSGGTVKNLIISMNGTLYAGVNQRNLMENVANEHYGVIAGRLIGGATISRCAIYRTAQDAAFWVTVDNNKRDDAYVGLFCGAAFESTIDQCYADVSVTGCRDNALPDGTQDASVRSDATMSAAMVTGALVKSTVSNCCLYYGEVNVQHNDPTLNSGYSAMAAPVAATASTGSKITNVFSRQLYLRIGDLEEHTVTNPNSQSPSYTIGSSGGHVGDVIGRDEGAGSADSTNITFCYMQDAYYVSKNTTYIAAAGDYAQAVAYLPVQVKDIWTTADNGYPVLKWLANSVSVTLTDVQTKGQPRDVAVTITPPEGISLSELHYSIKATVMGQEKTPRISSCDATAVQKVDTVTVSYTAAATVGTATDDGFYSGGTYGFSAQVDGDNIAAAPSVQWTVKDSSGSPLTSGSTSAITQNGVLTIPAGYEGKISVTAVCGGVSGTKDITAENPLSFSAASPFSVAAGAKAAFGVSVHYYGSTKPTVGWTVAGNASNKTSIDGDGILSVGSNESSTALVISASLTSGTTLSRNVAVTAAAQGSDGVETGTANVALTSGSEPAAQTVTVQSGEPLSVTWSAPTTPPSSYSTDAVTVTTAPLVAGNPAPSYVLTNGAYVFTGTGTAEILCARTYYLAADKKDMVDCYFAKLSVTIQSTGVSKDIYCSGATATGVTARCGQTITLTPILTSTQQSAVSGYTQGTWTANYTAATGMTVSAIDTATGVLTVTADSSYVASATPFSVSMSCTYTITGGTSITYTALAAISIAAAPQATITPEGNTTEVTSQNAYVTQGKAVTFTLPDESTSFDTYMYIPAASDSTKYSACFTSGTNSLTMTATASTPVGSFDFEIHRVYKNADGAYISASYAKIKLYVRAAPPAKIEPTYTQLVSTVLGTAAKGTSNEVHTFAIHLEDGISTYTGAVHAYRYAFSGSADKQPEKINALTGTDITGTDTSGTDASWYQQMVKGSTPVYLWLLGDAGDSATEDPYPAVADSRLVIYQLQYTAAGGVTCTQVETSTYPLSDGYKTQTVDVENKTYADADKVSYGTVRAYLSANYTDEKAKFWHTGDDKSSAFPALAPGTVRVSVTAEARLANAYLSETRNYTNSSSTQQLTLGSVVPAPLISARNASGLADNTFTISVPANATVYYKLIGLSTKGATIPVAALPANPANASVEGYSAYTAGTAVHVGKLADTDVQIVALAVAYRSGAYSDVDIVRFDVDSLSQPTSPMLLLGGKAFDATAAYTDNSGAGLEISFSHDTLAISATQNMVYYTLNNEIIPDPSDTASGNTLLYDPNNKPKLVFPKNADSFTINARILDTSTGRLSATKTFVVSAIVPIDAPQPSVASGTAVASGSNLYLGFTDKACEKIRGYQSVTNGGAYHSAAIEEYKKAVAAGEAPETVPDYANYVLASKSDTPIDGVSYLILKTSANQTTLTLPKIYYLVDGTESQFSQASETFQPAICQIYEAKNAAGTTVTYARFTNPSTVTLTGAAGAAHNIVTQMIASDATMENSAVTTYSYTIRGAANKPTSYPETAPAATDIKTLKGGETVSLLCDAGCEVYYTIDGTIPAITWDSWNKVWVPSGTTKKYTAAISFPAGNSSLVTINAITASTANTLDTSDRASFIFQPPSPVQAVYASVASDTAVVDGTSVSLLCGTTNAKIFYKTYTSAPADTDIPVAYQDTSYSGAIAVKQEVWIRAIATLDGVDSVTSTYHYTVAPKLTAPTVSLPAGSVVDKGTLLHLNGTGTIVFTLDGSDPATSANVQYGNSVILDADYGAAVTLRACVRQNGYTPSDTVSFTYTICAADSYVSAAPATGTTIASGTTVTLSTGVTGAQIFYTTDGSIPAVSNTYAAAAGKNYTDYEWSAASGTKAGNTLQLTGTPGATVTVRAMALANGSSISDNRLFTYTFRAQSGAPTASIPTGAVVLDGAAVTLTAKEGSIYYTTDGSTPTTSSALYTSPINVSGGMTLKAYAVADGKEASSVVTYVYKGAGQAKAPTFSLAAGAVTQGAAVSLASETKGASIYYSLDGTEPTEENLDSLTLYSSPIQITRGVTVKAIAVLSTMRVSEVSVAQYTVVEPTATPAPTPEATQAPVTTTDRLQSRRTYASAQTGTSYTDTVLTDKASGTVLSAQSGTVPDGAVMVVQQVAASAADEAAVRSAGKGKITAVYTVTLMKDGDVVQPQGEVEVGFAIPNAYQNAVVDTSQVNDDGTVTALNTRRSAGMAYIVTDKLDRYVLSVPEEENASGARRYLLPSAGIIAGAALLWLALWNRRRRRASDAAASAQIQAQADAAPRYASVQEFYAGADTAPDSVPKDTAGQAPQ